MYDTNEVYSEKLYGESQDANTRGLNSLWRKKVYICDDTTIKIPELQLFSILSVCIDWWLMEYYPIIFLYSGCLKGENFWFKSLKIRLNLLQNIFWFLSIMQKFLIQGIKNRAWTFWVQLKPGGWVYFKKLRAIF